MSTKLNELQNAVVGMTVGTMEVLTLQPLNYSKAMAQQGKPLTLNPRKLYRGIGAACAQMGGCTMIQFSAAGTFKQIAHRRNHEKHLSPATELLCGVGAGVVSAFAATPTELVMIQQQRFGGTALHTIQRVGKPAFFLRGFTGAAVREGLWTCGYLSLPPIIRRALQKSYPDVFDTDHKARIPAAILGGLFATYLTHPFDTVKTCMQGDIEREMYGTFTQTMRRIYAKKGITGFYRGATFRFSSVAAGVFIMDYLQDKVGPIIFPRAFEEEGRIHHCIGDHDLGMVHN